MSNLTVGRGLTGVRGDSPSDVIFRFGSYVLGEQHRKQRKMLNPVFSPQHLRSITPIFFNVAHKVGTFIINQSYTFSHHTDVRWNRGANRRLSGDCQRN